MPCILPRVSSDSPASICEADWSRMRDSVPVEAHVEARNAIAHLSSMDYVPSLMARRHVALRTTPDRVDIMAGGLIQHKTSRHLPRPHLDSCA